MRKFSSYGSINTSLHYYVPREDLINYAYLQLMGENPDEGGHYITVWAPRQRGKTSVMQQVMSKVKKRDDFEVGILTMQSAKKETTVEGVLDVLVTELQDWFGRKLPALKQWKELRGLFAPPYFTKPLILILDEFDMIEEGFISDFVNEFRSMHTKRANELDKKSNEKSNLLHGLALIGVRGVLGIENMRGSPFNVQRSLQVPNLTFAEVAHMFKWYEQESGQKVEQAVIEQIFYETNGQPGLVGWLGELLTQTYNDNKTSPLTLTNLSRVMLWAIDGLGNANVLNIINKAKQKAYKPVVLDLFKTDQKRKFRYDDPQLNFLYLNGVIDIEEAETTLYIKFPCPFIQKRLFNYFSSQLFKDMGQLYNLFDDLNDVFTSQGLNIQNLLKRYEDYLQQNHTWLFKNAPRRYDLRLYEAVYHFNLYMYLSLFLQRRQGTVWPEFPTGNGKIDLIIKYDNQTYGLEVKSFADPYEYKKALSQAADYAAQLKLTEITLVLFIEAVDDKNRAKYEVVYQDPKRDIKVMPTFVVTSR